MLVEIGVYAPKAEQSKASKIFGDMLKKNNDIINRIFGSKGFGDIGLSSSGN